MTERSKFIHYSAQPLTNVHSVEQVSEISRYMKPDGLWFSVEPGHGWFEWCEAEQFCLDRLEFATRIILKDDADILRISNEEELIAFHKRFCTNLHPGIASFPPLPSWDVVAMRYRGIIIAPYIWSMRLHTEMLWYYTWDCASGCVWDASAIERLEPLTSYRKALGQVEESVNAEDDRDDARADHRDPNYSEHA